MQLTEECAVTSLAHREPVQVQAEKNNTENTEQELGDGNADHTGNGENIVRQLPLLQCGDHAQRNAQNRRNDQSRQRKLHSCGQLLHHQLAHRHVVL